MCAAPKGNQYAKKENPKDDNYSFRVHKKIIDEMEKIAKALNLTTTEHIIRSTTGKR